MKILEKDIPASVLVFGSTILGYLVAYLFELGYLNYYKIDYNFIQITATQLILGSVFAFFALIFGLAWILPPKKKRIYDESKVVDRFKKEMRSLLYIALSFLVVVGIVGFVLSSRLPIYLCISLFGFIYIIIGLLILFQLIKFRNIEQALVAYFKQADRSNANSDQSQLPPELIKGLFIIIVVCGFSYISGNIFGRPSQSTDKNHKVSTTSAHTYSVIEDGSRYLDVVVRRYNDTLLIKQYDKSTQQFFNGFKTEDVNNKQFIRERLLFKSR